ncbi:MULTISPECIES: bifunctional phosphopantothenoylcysteine decarboxylase/phosphopantothenate--cysteine ligase CoaBC [unclassified Gilliamella]|uniref:bifunctional phosphopantothenoylcysteine decarboxylase/phosphopantothenate--cysteine ligase CoaBC n=1 Tax=unclassified Gilliamella TaxID=2685620 RepID=UPI00226A2DB4|nr:MULTISPECIES: bifunctional phosphopantothenoylcysteine decarboxylase/phosphopantothenate--cysteine ligase CoaBC [unclassified Gilliamella]MCX8597526.1 bifunctional phosphopantothenoylcysteine decarboxylase/phosphopantothenate--cysteine ligase CoaBC [Gilliamella sp. B3493]MCX8599691.1 bifunctional phosphopantothenoylcysteine decarboxylase/phosphopantothenate--cysteine ligase CoaBC [Gilliamella sp. B3486]MCX8689966.1 bifunctional phosphopantothenoylcysteine decarboxylase/phosphopantothenate--cy
MSLSGKHILLGITGGIAAYKCPDLVRHLKKAGAQVHVVLTESANHFVTPMTLQALSGNTVSSDLFDPSAELSMSHIELAKWADLVLIAPATANIIAKMANGIADDLLSTVCLATPAKIAIAPAMNQQMYKAAATQQNLATLASRNTLIWGPDDGFQACGDFGPGRMVEPATIFKHVEKYFSATSTLAGTEITITAGPTIEELDPVRYISNYSSGKMGYAIAQAAAEIGATVNLISGPVNLATPNNVNRINVKSANEMYDVALKLAKKSSIFISCAAVADYRAETIATKKIKKTDDSNELVIKLVKNPDIVANIASLKKGRPFVVGFAAETNNIKAYALKKLTTKNLDLICANDVSDKKIGFNSDQNALTLYWQNGEQTLPLSNKQELAKELLQAVITRYKASHDEKKN